MLPMIFLAACGSGVPPVLQDDEGVTPEDTPLVLNVLANDENASSVSRITRPVHGTVRTVAAGILYTPAADFYGEDTFAYEVSGVQANVHVTVTPVNDPPRAETDIRYTAALGPSAAFTEQLITVFDNDTDPEGDALTLQSVSEGEFGEAWVVDAQAGIITYRRHTNVEPDGRTEHLIYRVSDTSGAESQGEVLIVLEAIAGAPLAIDDELAITAGQSSIIPLLENDLFSAPVAVSLERAPRALSVSINAAGQARVSAPNDFIGSDYFEYRLQPLNDPDGENGAATSTSGNGTVARVRVTAYSDIQAVSAVETAPQLLLPALGIYPQELAVVVNTDDPDSASLAAAYMEARHIPETNRVEVSLGQATTVVRGTFDAQLHQAEARLPESIQGYALMFRQPFRVECMSITSAFAFGGFNTRFCKRPGTCTSTDKSPYFSSDSAAPHTDHAVRPAMMLAAYNSTEASALISRGVAADNSFPTGTGYFVKTRDTARSVRWPVFESTVESWNTSGALLAQYFDFTQDPSAPTDNSLRGLDDILFYQTGLVQVVGLDTLAFRPGAVADHFTSSGGDLTGQGSQMSAMAWLQAGATGSYGTVVEPCNYTQKFPRSDILLDHYYRGNSLLEAYWKSVEWPGEGVFIGEPLSHPWGRKNLTYTDKSLTLETTELQPGNTYALQAADHAYGPFETIREIMVEQWGLQKLVVSRPEHRFYRLEREK